MKRRKRHAFIRIIAAFSLMLFLFSSWLKPLDINEAAQQIKKSEQLAYVVPTSSSIYLSETKPRLSGFSGGLSPILYVVANSHFQYQNIGPRDWNLLVVVALIRPLWLLNRSLLI